MLTLLGMLSMVEYRFVLLGLLNVPSTFLFGILHKVLVGDSTFSSTEGFFNILSKLQTPSP